MLLEQIGKRRFVVFHCLHTLDLSMPHISKVLTISSMRQVRLVLRVSSLGLRCHSLDVRLVFMLGSGLR